MGERIFRSYQEAQTFAKGLAKKGLTKTKLIPSATDWKVICEDAPQEEFRGHANQMPNELRVGYFAERRLVVYDPKCQPSDPTLMLIYSVHGHALCCMLRQNISPKLSWRVSGEIAKEALQEYQLWLKENPDGIAAKISGNTIDAGFPLLRIECPACGGAGTWMDRLNKCSYGVVEEESNIVERCSHCQGSGVMDDFLSNRLPVRKT